MTTAVINSSVSCYTIVGTRNYRPTTSPSVVSFDGDSVHIQRHYRPPNHFNTTRRLWRHEKTRGTVTWPASRQPADLSHAPPTDGIADRWLGRMHRERSSRRRQLAKTTSQVITTERRDELLQASMQCHIFPSPPHNELQVIRGSAVYSDWWCNTTADFRSPLRCLEVSP